MIEALSADHVICSCNAATSGYNTEVVGDLLEVARNPGKFVASLVASRATDRRKASWDINKIENLCGDSLTRPERFIGEHKVARELLRTYIPRKRARIFAELLILDFGSDRMRRDFVLGEPPARERLVQYIIRRGGIYHLRQNRNPVWVELSS